VATSKTLLIGSNPSNKSPDNSPFHVSTRSRSIVDEWFKEIDTQDRVFLNISNEKKEGNKALNMKEIQSRLPDLSGQLCKFEGYKIVTLGKTASKALTLLRVDFYELPHPSGLNRLLNDKNYIAEKIKGLQSYLSP